MNIGTPVSAPPRETSSNLVLYLVIAILLALGIVAMLSSGVLAGALLVFA